MLKLNPVDVGPIIGEANTQRLRIWGRGGEGDIEGHQRSHSKRHGVLRVTQSGETVGEAVFKLTSLWDYSGVGVVTGLSGGESYQYQIGWFESDIDTGDYHNALPAIDWDSIPSHTVTIASDDDRAERSFIVGSCRYNLPWTSDDKPIDDTRGDKTFKAVLSLFASEQKADALIMLGDQIYADIYGVGVSTLSSFHRLYRGAFRQESLRELMSTVPTFMTLDDHEIEENWPEHASEKDHYQKKIAALLAFQAYQISHSPLLDTKDGRLDGLPDKWWYEFKDGCCKVFMMDVRTERDLKREKIVKDEQLNALLKFLNSDPDLVKVIGSSVPFVPEMGDDKWSGFSEQRKVILDYILEEKIPKVVFVSGDVHFSGAAQITCDSDPDFKVLSVTCSPFFWPLPHWAPGDYEDISGSNAVFSVEKLTKNYRKENFVRLQLSPDQAVFEVHKRKGGLARDPYTFTW